VSPRGPGIILHTAKVIYRPFSLYCPMANKDDKGELIDAGQLVEKPAEKKDAPAKAAMPEAPKAAAPPQAPSGLTENKNEPHIHLMVLLIIVIILGVVIAFIKF